MKIFYLLLFFTTFCLAQKEINLDNNLTCTSIQSDNTKSIGFSYTGDNSLIVKNFDISSNTSYTYLTNIQDEISQRVNIMYRFPDKKINDYSFVTYQFNSSLIRNIQTDHWVGVGYGVKNKIDSTLTISTSYALIYQDIHRNIGDDNFFRHSLRLKIKLLTSKVELTSEYFYQPNIQYFNDYLIVGTSRLIIMPKDKINFVIQDVVSYGSAEDIKLLNTISLGIQYKFNKKF
jgi:hypothetical protein